jgi:hypothetical protein
MKKSTYKGAVISERMIDELMKHTQSAGPIYEVINDRYKLYYREYLSSLKKQRTPKGVTFDK